MVWRSDCNSVYCSVCRRVLLDVGERGNADYISSLTSVLKEYDTMIDKIFISHWHHDHIGGLKDVLGCCEGKLPFFLNKKEELVISLIVMI